MEKIWLSPPHMGGEELKFINEAFETNWIAPIGPHVDAFEKEVCIYLKTKYAAAVSCGTAAIHLALIIVGVEPGDEVICQSMTFCGSANPIIYQKAIPVFIDSENESWNMSPDLLEKAIEERIKKHKKPKAVIVVHLYGQPAQLDRIEKLCTQYEIPLIEDAAEALGSSYHGRKTGTFGAMSILSFNGNKIITTSNGGMLLSDNKHFIEKAKFLATQARDDAPHYEHSQIGYNYRLSNVLAAIGRGQLKVLEQRIQRKREINRYYKDKIGNLAGISFQPELEKTFSNKWLTAIIIDQKKFPANREEIYSAFNKENIDSRPLWKPMHLQPVFSGAPSYINGISEKLFAQGLCLPSGTNLTESQLDRICNVIRRFYR
jgi:dTDP-4-amino-4,6-dideoxygalactose transaminase